MGPNCCSPGSGQYCRQGWEQGRGGERREQVISPHSLEAEQIIMSAASDGEASNKTPEY